MPSAPIHIMAKPVGPICNLDCSYCFYLEKEELYPDTRSWRMNDDLLERYIREFIALQDGPDILFAWQGGEPTLLGVDYFRNVVALQRKHADGKRIANTLQTNGTLIDDEWAEFLRANSFLTGVSIDGPREIHDTYRVDKQQRPTFDAVMRGIGCLKRHGVEFNTLTVVSHANAAHPLEVYRFLKEIGSGFIQFIPLVERALPGSSPHGLLQISLPASRETAPVTDWSVGASEYGDFLIAVFDEWVRHDVGTVFVQLFDVALGNWMGLGSGLCVFAETCGHALALEHNGDVYSCDHYVYPEYRLGNLGTESLKSVVGSESQRKFGADKRDTLPQDCLGCEVRFACNGDCPKHRFERDSHGGPGLSYLCPSYKAFFSHIDPHMRIMGHLLRERRPAARIMDIVRSVEKRQAANTPAR
jgi:uncharacterized protein